jgi:glycosyltransferase involved in cell wall biosynthesis
MPTVSVIIPNFNHARYLPRRIASVREQTFQDFELILLDDCSTDDSRSILSSYADDSRVKIEFNRANSGSTFKQWNKGVRLARGKYVWIAESDDYADERLLERLVAVLEAEPKAAFAYCRSWRVNEVNQLHGFVDQYLNDLDAHRWTRDYCSDGPEECRKYFVFCNIVANASAVLFRRTAYAEVGGADESFQMCGDWKLWASMALRGKVVHLGQPLNYFRFHDESVGGRDIGRGVLAQESLRVVRWMLDQVTITDAARAKLCQTLSDLWVPAVITWRVPLGLKWTILRNATAIDSRAIRRVVRTSLVALWIKVRKHRR